jgi:hypothetical protein
MTVEPDPSPRPRRPMSTPMSCGPYMTGLAADFNLSPLADRRLGRYLRSWQNRMSPQPSG